MRSKESNSDGDLNSVLNGEDVGSAAAATQLGRERQVRKLKVSGQVVPP